MKGRRSQAWAWGVLLLAAVLLASSGCASSKAWAYTKEKAWPDVKAVVLVHAPSIALRGIDDLLSLVGLPIGAIEWGVQQAESIVVPGPETPAPAPNP